MGQSSSPQKLEEVRRSFEFEVCAPFQVGCVYYGRVRQEKPKACAVTLNARRTLAKFRSLRGNRRIGAGESGLQTGHGPLAIAAIVGHSR